MKKNKIKTSFLRTFAKFSINYITHFIMLIILIALFVILFFVPKMVLPARIIYAISTILGGILIYIIKSAFKEKIKNLFNKNKIDEQKFDIKEIIFIILSICIILINTVGDVILAITPSYSSLSETSLSGTQTESSVDKSHAKYELKNALEWEDINFSKENNETELADNIEYAIREIGEERVVSDKELNITENYGSIALDAIAHEKELQDLLNSNQYIKNGILPKECHKYYIDLRNTMENTHKTPSNRKTLMNDHLIGGKYNLGESQKDEFEKAVHFAWGYLYISIAWDQYDNLSIPYIIDAYEHLKTVTTDLDEIEQIETTIKALRIIEIRLNDNPPIPIKSNTK